MFVLLLPEIQVVRARQKKAVTERASRINYPRAVLISMGGLMLHFRPRPHYAGKIKTFLEKFEDATITGHFGFVFEKNSMREIT